LKVLSAGRVDLLALDAGVGQRFLEGLDHQVLRIAVPALAESAAHAEDDDLVPSSGRHGVLP
jgi:hypothetical protein